MRRSSVGGRCCGSSTGSWSCCSGRTAAAAPGRLESRSASSVDSFLSEANQQTVRKNPSSRRAQAAAAGCEMASSSTCSSARRRAETLDSTVRTRARLHVRCSSGPAALSLPPPHSIIVCLCQLRFGFSSDLLLSVTSGAFIYF